MCDQFYYVFCQIRRVKCIPLRHSRNSENCGVESIVEYYNGNSWTRDIKKAKIWASEQRSEAMLEVGNRFPKIIRHKHRFFDYIRCEDLHDNY